MLEMYKAECRRFGRWAAGLGGLHLGALLLLDRSFPGLREAAEIAAMLAAGYFLTGTIFGFYQLASYARANHWVQLLHRPLAPWRIMVAVVGAAATVLVLAVLIPTLLFTAGLTLQAGRVVDVRHWWLPVGGALMALIGLGVGGFVALAPRRYGWTALIVATMLTLSNLEAGVGVRALLLPLLVVGGLAVLLAGAFRPDRTGPPERPALLAVTAAAVALSLFFLLMGGGAIAYQLTLIALGRNPLVGTPPQGGLVEASRAEGSDLIAAALTRSSHPAAAEARARLRTVEATRLPIAVDVLPARGELTNTGPNMLVDPRRGVQWTFSHDANAFLGLRLADQRAAGALRPTGGFPAPPLPLGDGTMIAGDSLYRLDRETGAIVRSLRLPGGETIAAKPAKLGPVVAVLGDRALHLHDPGVLDGRPARLPAVAVPLPGLVGDLRRLDAMPLDGGFVLSFFFGRDSIEGPSRAWQRVVSVDPDGSVRTLAERALGPDQSPVLRFRSYWMSPVLRAVAVAAEGIGASPQPIQRREPIRVPREVWIGAALLALVSAVAAALLARRRRLSRREGVAWTLATLVLGLPMLVAFWLVRTRRRLTP
jgi:hypothetical protein